MKKLSKLLTKVITLTLGVFIFSGIHVRAAEPLISTPSQAYAEAMQPGWNLGNTFDAFDTNGDRGELSWGNPLVTKELIHTIKGQGFNSIRMPFTAMMRVGGAPDYKIDPTFLARYAEVVNWALDEGLYVMINIHHDSWNWAKNIGTDDGSAMEQYKAVWTQLANYFKDYPEQVCFESLNEPAFQGTDARQIEINNLVNETFYSIVRDSGGNNATRMLVLPTLNTNDSQDRCTSLYDSIKKLNDSNIIATFHYYGAWAFGVNIAGKTTFDDWVKEELENAFDRVYDTFVTNGIGVICGEYGLLGFDTALGTIEHGEMLKYFEYFGHYAKQKGVTTMLWDNGQHMNRYNYTWSDEALYNIIEASQVTRSSYTDSDRIFVNQSSKGQAAIMGIVLNGNELQGIYNGNKQLILGADYTYVNNTVTFTSDYMDRIVDSQYGVNETLTMKFTSGADWRIFVTYYKSLELEIAQGSASQLLIPTTFNGSIISTMEATYQDGSAAGPQNWTTFKEYGYTFAPDYEKGNIIIKDKLLTECLDGVINLTFHLQSGEKIIYVLNKSGSTVTGVPTATDPVDPTDPIEPTDPVDPTEPTDPTASIDVKVATQISHSINQNYTITVTGEDAIDCSKLAIRYYFSKNDEKAMSFWCDHAAAQLNEAPWYTVFGDKVVGTLGKDEKGSYLEITNNYEIEIQPNSGTLTIQTRFSNSDWSSITNFTEGQVVVLYNGIVIK